MGSLRGHVCETLHDLRGDSVRRVHGAGYGRAEHMCSRGEPLGLRGLFFLCAGDVLAARVFGIRQEGVKPCRMVPSMKGRGTRQLHDVTGKVQHVRLRIAMQSARCASCRAGRACKFKNTINLEQ